MKNQIILVSLLAAMTTVGCIDVVEKKDSCVAKCDTKDGKNIAISCLGHGRSIEIVCDDAAPTCDLNKEKNTAVCKPKPCESVCSEDKTSVFKCDANGKLSKTPESCGDHIMCVKGECKCFAICTKTGKIRTCDDNGKLKDPDNCPNSGETCLDGKKGESDATCGTKTECKEKCDDTDNKKIFTCKDNKLSESSVECSVAYEGTDTCNKETGKCEKAAEVLCTNDRCKDGKLQKCNEGKLDEPVLCANTQVCVEEGEGEALTGACKERKCDPVCDGDKKCVANPTNIGESICGCVPQCTDNGNIRVCEGDTLKEEETCRADGKECYKSGGNFDADFCGCADYCEKVEGEPEKAHQCESLTETKHKVIECTGETPVCEKDSQTGKATCVAKPAP